MAYREFAAPAAIADLVACTWERAVADDAGPLQRVLPDGCVDLVWTGGRLIVAGPDTHVFMSPLPKGATVVGLRLRPGAAGAALRLPASELGDARPALEDVWGRTGAELAERLGIATTAADRRRLLEDAITAARTQIAGPDPLVVAAARGLGLPGSRVADVSRTLGIGERQLRRRFLAAVGYGPKTLDRVLRFQRFIARASQVATGEDALARVAAELGYADQAHMTRDCVELSGLTPAALLDERS